MKRDSNTALVTGGAGFIGSHLVEYLLAEGWRVTVLDDLSTGSRNNLQAVIDHPGLKLVVDSILNAKLVKSLVSRSACVYHLAASVGVKLIVKDPAHSIQANVVGTDIVLRACAARGCPVLLVSSSEVYGKSTELPFQEDGDIVLGATTHARWSYACSKAIGEFLAHAYFQKMSLPVVITRFFNVAGPRQTGHYGMVIPRFVDQALAGKPITVYGSGRQSRCFCHVADIVPALVKLVWEKKARGKIVNLGDDDIITIHALARRVKQVTGSKSKIVKVSFEEVYGQGFEDMRARQPDLSRARALIGYRPKYGLDRILFDVIDHARARTKSTKPVKAGRRS
ncbi:MAG: NAD-dependent epimerase/dehydratase family protein [bacterium]